MSLEHRVIDMIKHHEGVKQRPYQCPALLWTVGVGHVIDPNHARVLLAELAHLCLSPSMLDSVISKILPFG